MPFFLAVTAKAFTSLLNVRLENGTFALALLLLALCLSLFLILNIFLRIPQENVGLTSFATRSNLLGSPSSAQRFLNILTALGILIYLGIAIQLNLVND